MRRDRLVAPGVSLLAVLALLLVARTYEALPVKPPPCSLRNLTGIPCVGCGGTRSMKALARGEVVEAAAFNPLAVLGVFAVVLWFVWTVTTMKMERYQGGAVAETASAALGKSGRRWGLVITVLVVLNWIYLICYLPS